nr:hypothetical protein RCYEFQYI_RCYEFQYI_CDS_0008 [Microvirus sp.]
MIEFKDSVCLWLNSVCLWIKSVCLQRTETGENLKQRYKNKYVRKIS